MFNVIQNKLQEVMSETQSPAVYMAVFPFWMTGVAIEYAVETVEDKISFGIQRRRNKRVNKGVSGNVKFEDRFDVSKY